MKKEDVINNSFEILDLFERNRSEKLYFYHPLSKIFCKATYDQRPGKCKVYTKEEIFIYKISSFQNKTVLYGR